MILSLLYDASRIPDQYPHPARRRGLSSKFSLCSGKASGPEQFYNIRPSNSQRGRPPRRRSFRFRSDQHRGRGKTYKLAFLEGNGEWNQRDENSFKQFKQEIAVFLACPPRLDRLRGATVMSERRATGISRSLA